MVFCDTLFCSVSWRFIGEMYEGEQVDFKNRYYSHVTSACPNRAAERKIPKTLRKRLSSDFTQVRNIPVLFIT